MGQSLTVKTGHRFSLQYHERKHEAQYVDSGRIKYTLGSSDRPGEYREVIAGPGTVVVLPAPSAAIPNPRVSHRRELRRALLQSGLAHRRDGARCRLTSR